MLGPTQGRAVAGVSSGERSFDFTASVSSITYLLATIRRRKARKQQTWKGGGARVKRRPALDGSAFLLFSIPSVSFSTSMCSFTRLSIGRGQAFHTLWTRVHTYTDRASFSCIKARCIFRVFLTPFPVRLSTSSRSQSYQTLSPLSSSPLYLFHALRYRTRSFRIGCALLSVFYGLVDNRLTATSILPQRNIRLGCRWLTLWGENSSPVRKSVNVARSWPTVRPIFRTFQRFDECCFWFLIFIDRIRRWRTYVDSVRYRHTINGRLIFTLD